MVHHLVAETSVKTITVTCHKCYYPRKGNILYKKIRKDKYITSVTKTNILNTLPLYIYISNLQALWDIISAVFFPTIKYLFANIPLRDTF